MSSLAQPTDTMPTGPLLAPAPRKTPRPPGALDVLLSELRYHPHVQRNAAAALGFGAACATVAVSALAKRGPARTVALSSAISLGVGLALGRSQLARFFSEQPSFEIESRSPGLQIRRYRGAVTLRTFVASNLEGHGLDRAIDEGFDRLFAYISGQNAAHEKISMLAPVLVRPTLGGSFVSFFLPASRTKNSFPKPTDARVSIAWTRAKRIAVLRYSGDFKSTDRQTLSAELSKELRSRQIKALSEPSFAGYDAPYVLKVLRRNEVWVEV